MFIISLGMQITLSQPEACGADPSLLKLQMNAKFHECMNDLLHSTHLEYKFCQQITLHIYELIIHYGLSLSLVLAMFDIL